MDDSRAMERNKLFHVTQFSIEQLECRTLLSTLPWSAAAQLIHQDDAVAGHASLNGAGQTIAVIDTGIDYTHPSLGGGFGSGFKVVGGFDFVDNDADPKDTSGHGTAVAGMLAANAFDFSGSHWQGIAPGAKLIALRVTDRTDVPAPDERIQNAFQWVIDHRAEFNITLVNISFGFGHFADPNPTGPFSSQIATLTKAGVPVFAASGNGGIASGQGIEYPAADPNVISVGSVNTFDVISEFSERGKMLDLLAPGEGVASTALSGSFSFLEGTSFSSPQVAGTAALLRELNPALKPKELLSILRTSGSTNFDGDDEFSNPTHLRFPRLNVENAIEVAEKRQPNAGGNSAVGLHGTSNSIAFDQQGILHFAYYDAADTTIKYATRDTDGNWSGTSIVDSSTDDSGQFLSLAIKSDGKPAIAYFDATKGDLNYASFTGHAWAVESVDTKGSVGLYPSLAFDANDNANIAYYRKASGDLRLARFDSTTGNWAIRPIDTRQDSGRSTSLARMPDGHFAVAYENSTTGNLKYASEDATGSWLRVTPDNTRGVAFVSLAFDAVGRPALSYYDAAPADLKYAVVKRGAWTTNTVASKGAVGLYTKLFFNDASGNANVVFFNKKSNTLNLARGYLGHWDTSVLMGKAGRFIATAPDPENVADVTLSFFNGSEGKLDFTQI